MPISIFADSFIKDKEDAAEGLRKAILYAREHQVEEIVLGAGVYRLKSYITIETPSIAHDDGCGDIKEKDCHILLKDLKRLKLRGEVAEDGSPATVLEGLHEDAVQCLLPSIIWAENCDCLTLENLAFIRNQEMASAGTVTEIHGDTISVRVFDGLPCRDGMAAYCMNRFDIQKRRLLGKVLPMGLVMIHVSKRWVTGFLP